MLFRLDVIEGQWAIIIIHLLTFKFGQNIWNQNILLGMTATHILFSLSILALISSIFKNISLITGADSPMDKFIRIPRKTDKTKWNPMFPLIIITTFAIIGYESGIFQTNPIVFIFIFGLSFAKLSFKLQVILNTFD